MRIRNYFGKLILSTTAALAAAGTLQVQGQNLVVDNFNTAGGGVSFWADSWGTGATVAFSTENSDKTVGSGIPAGSGSLRVESPAFTGAGGWEQVVIEKPFSPVLKASLYTSVSVDIKVDPTSSPKANGQYGLFELKYGGGATAYPGSMHLPSSATNGWMTVTFTVPAAAPDVDILRFQLGDGDYTGKIIYYIDNLRYNAPRTLVNQFDDATEVDFIWTPTWGTSPVLTFDATDAGGSTNPASGSLKVTADYFTPIDNGWEQMVVTRNFDTVIVGADHKAINFDVKVDPSSVLTTEATRPYGLFEPKLPPGGAAIGGLELSRTNWVNVTFDFQPNAADLTALLLQNGAGTFQGPITYYFDNLSFIQRVGGPVLALVTGPLDDMRRDGVVLNWVLNDGAFEVDTASVVLKLDGTNAPAANVTVTKTATGATVDFNDAGNLWASGIHTWNLTFTDTTPTNSVTGNGTFIVNPFPTDGTFVIEAEDWNYGGGLFNPMVGVADRDVNVMPYLGNAYDTLSSVAGVDYVGDDGNDSDLYRTELDGTGQNAVNIANNFGGRYGADRGTYSVDTNYRFGWVAGGEWHNYTRNFPATNYTVWAALSIAGRDPNTLAASLDLVTSTATTSSQTVLRLGSFSGPGTDGWGRNTLVPMRTASGAIPVYKMGGEQTVRFNVGSGDFDFFLFVPTGDVLSPPIITGAKLTGGNITVTWFNGGTLWKSPSPTGPWTTTGDSDGSYTEPAATGNAFFRATRITP